MRTQQSPLLDDQLLSAPAQSLSAAHGKARAAVDLLVMTDASLLYPPGVLAVAAMRSGFRGVQLGCHKYLQHIAHRALQAAAGAAGGGSSSVSPAEAEQRLLASLAAVDDLAAKQAQINEAAMQGKATEVDRTIKLWKKSMAAQRTDSGKGTTPPPPGTNAAAGAANG